MKQRGGGLSTRRTIMMLLLVSVALAFMYIEIAPVKALPGLTVDLYGGAVNGGHGNLVGIFESTDLAFPAPYGGEGPNNPMDVAEPQTLVYLNAYVTKFNIPVQFVNVTFRMQEPNSTVYTQIEGVTDLQGVVSNSTRMPWPATNPESLLGLWTVTVTVQVADELAVDSMQFQYDYIVHIWNVTTDNPLPEPGPPAGYGHGDPLNIHVNYGSYYMQQLPISQPYPVLILAQVTDNLNVTIGTAEVTTAVGGASWGEYKNSTVNVNLDVPKSAAAGPATVSISVFDGLEPKEGGVAITPVWVGPTVEILPISVPSKGSLTFFVTGVGTDFNGTLLVVDGVNYSLSQLPVSFIWIVGSTHNFTFLSPLIGSIRRYQWVSTTGLFTLQSASIAVTAVCANIIGNYLTGLHGVIITNVTAPAYTYQDIPVIPHECANITVTVENVGDFPENATVYLYYNITADQLIGSFPVHLEVGQNFTHLFIWTTVGIPTRTYTLTAVATIPTGSFIYTDGNITVRIKGDVNGDGRVDLRDIVLVARAFGSTPTSPNWNPAADINGDGVVDMKDMALVIRFFGRSTTY